METRHLFIIQTAILLGGTIFAWSQTLPQFGNFYTAYGTFFRFEDCVIPNPLATACFYGSIAFVVALLWSFRIMQNPDFARERRLKNFLILCVLFAGSVFLYEVIDYYNIFSESAGAFPISCTPGVFPLKTPCFYGLLFFAGSLVASVFVIRGLKGIRL